MTPEPQQPADTTPTSALPVVAPATDPARKPGSSARNTVVALIFLTGLALVSSFMLWQKVAGMQEQLARQSADAGSNAIEARALARQAQEIARDAAARQAVLETRLGEVTLQRAQLEQLMQSLTFSRDENLLVDVEASLALAQQQTQLTGSAEPLLAALRGADQRLARAAQPRLARLRAAIARDVDRVRSASVTDVPGVLARIDELVRQVDELPTLNAVGARPAAEPAKRPASAAPAQRLWWEQWLGAVSQEVRGLVRVSRIDQPEAALVAPEQAFFLRENLKLKLLNARLSVLARQNDVARADLMASAGTLQKYFDPASRRTQAAATQLQQLQLQLRGTALPRIDETLAALAAVNAAVR